ncbi:ankyrin repeat protein [Reticulomyxa filosa]|uniref:Ankyrin repeat protein n=1 Tax=Reticulomyxa filosa TaxID=46433 RepID=X6M0A5_RETFI|nr:ankyrin repeat protein [Reticulomyxa filosa]|eukprot:ETO06380.1 ankyrin repeat protein [Reticulomyxa filosa]
MCVRTFSDKNRSTVLFTACWYCQYEVAELLVRFGADVNHTNIKGNSAIHMSLEQNDLETVKLLILNNANISTNDLYALMDRVSTLTIEPDIVKCVSRAELKENDNIWYQHHVFGLVRAIVKEKQYNGFNSCRLQLQLLASTSPVFYRIRRSELETVPLLLWVSVLDECIKPILETQVKPLRDLITSKHTLLNKFKKWDAFWLDHYQSHDNCYDMKHKENYYLQDLKHVKMKQKSVTLQKINRLIKKHPHNAPSDDSNVAVKKDSVDKSQSNHCNTEHLCEYAKQHAHKFDVVMNTMIQTFQNRNYE